MPSRCSTTAHVEYIDGGGFFNCIELQYFHLKEAYRVTLAARVVDSAVLIAVRGAWNQKIIISQFLNGCAAIRSCAAKLNRQVCIILPRRILDACKGDTQLWQSAKREFFKIGMLAGF